MLVAGDNIKPCKFCYLYDTDSSLVTWPQQKVVMWQATILAVMSSLHWRHDKAFALIVIECEMQFILFIRKEAAT
jgi:hypothetical protein